LKEIEGKSEYNDENNQNTSAGFIEEKSLNADKVLKV